MTEECNVMVNSEESISTTECLAVKDRCRKNRCRYSGVRLYLYL
jgi:hypothetical protein